MPARNRIKPYLASSCYHLYNRGVAKQKIYCDDQDYAVFLSYLKNYLEPKDELMLQQIIANPKSGWKEKDKAIKLLRLNNFFDNIELMCYVLMPNHFHFLIKQKEADAIDRFMNSLCTRYTMYFNKKYKRVGPLFQSVYKAGVMKSDNQLLYLTRYIHRNPLALGRQDRVSSRILLTYPLSSYSEYIKLRKTAWVYPASILDQFSKTGCTSYQSFVEDNDSEENMISIISQVKID
jgi:putative transposase